MRSFDRMLKCSFCYRKPGFPCAGCAKRTCGDCHSAPKHQNSCPATKNRKKT